MIADAISIFDTAWWYMTFPGVALLLTVLAFNLDRRWTAGRAQSPDGALRGARRERAVHSVPQQGGEPMRRSVRWTLFASVITALALFVAACGGSNNSSSSGGGGSKTATGQSKVAGRQARWHADLSRRRRRRLHRPGPDVLHVRLHGPVRRRTAPLYSFKPDNSVKPVPDLATGPPEISSDNKTITVHIKKGVKYAPPVNREVKTAGHQVRLRARVLQGGPQRLRGHLLQLDRRHAGRSPTAATSSRSRASRRRTTPRSSSSSRRRARRSSRRRS